MGYPEERCRDTTVPSRRACLCQARRCRSETVRNRTCQKTNSGSLFWVMQFKRENLDGVSCGGAPEEPGGCGRETADRKADVYVSPGSSHARLPRVTVSGSHPATNGNKVQAQLGRVPQKGPGQENTNVSRERIEESQLPKKNLVILSKFSRKLSKFNVKARNKGEVGSSFGRF
ncbi:hypothetical protein RUM43_005867 [Polyplax serrata]|uniref:Uncharacterized protein n=1 Tax=Polyplax serrata TaxID=468196 RepID=A0AAN8S1S1_POLSC